MKPYILLILLLISGDNLANPTDNLNFVGQAKLKVLFWDIYESYLYIDEKEYKPDTYPIALKIRYLRDISKEDLLERTNKEWKDLGLTSEQRQHGITLVEDIWPDITKGDELVIIVDENQESTFYFNQKSIAHIEDRTFGPQFLDIWLSENCSRPELRQQLMGKS